MKQITVGKSRGLQQLSSQNGIFTICSLDHRRSLRNMICPDNPASVAYEDMVDFKLQVCEVMAPYVSGILLDPIYGTCQAIVSRSLPGSTGLLVSLETAGYDEYGADGLTEELFTDWTSDKLKAIGVSGVKVPFYYRPDLPFKAPEHLNSVIKIASHCTKGDLSLFVGPHSYSIPELEQLGMDFPPDKVNLVLDTAKQLSALPIDVLKTEFPMDGSDITDNQAALHCCLELSEISRVPWVLLSGGEDFEVFRRQLEIACRGGASGFLAGRAVWQEATTMNDVDRREFLKTTGVERIKSLVEIAHTYAAPWYEKLLPINNYSCSDTVTTAVDVKSSIVNLGGAKATHYPTV